MADAAASLFGGAAAGGGPAGGGMQSLLDALGSSDPKLGMIAQWLAERQATSADAAGADDAAEQVADEALRHEAALEEERRRAEQLRRLCRKMFAELEELRQRNDQLADALGACYLCWGERPLCPVCHGRGAPGWAAPDPRLFRDLALPAVQLMRAPAQARAAAAPACPSDENLHP